MNIYRVGGAVRDLHLGIPSKDHDFAVELTPGIDAAKGFDLMREHLVGNGYTIFLETPEYGTIRAHFPNTHPEFGKVTADFTLCRTEGPYSDGRRPDWIRTGTILDDLARRDFTVNAMAVNIETGEGLDPHDGLKDLRLSTLRCVGEPEDRLTEDALRGIRALRFIVTRAMHPDTKLEGVLYSEWLPPLLSSISAERRREELGKMFKHNTPLSMWVLHYYASTDLVDAAFEGDIWLKATLESR